MDSSSSPAESMKNGNGKRKAQQTTVKSRNKAAAEKKQAAGKRANSSPDNCFKKDAEGSKLIHLDEENNQGITSILTQLGSELQQRLKVKKQRLESCFDSVRATPNAILETLNSHTEERMTMIEGFKAQSMRVLQDVENVLNIQKITEEKFSKMLLNTQKNFDQVKEALTETITGLNDAVQKFVNETDALEEKHGGETQNQLQQIKQELADLQKKILSDGHQEEQDNLKTQLQHLV